MPLFDLARPALFRLDPERAHGLTLAGLKLLPPLNARHDPVLATHLAGIEFPSPIGLAAGFDKDAEVPDAMLGLGFGFVEVGTIDRKSTRLNSSHVSQSRMPSSA